jgi:hypothetical protein
LMNPRRMPGLGVAGPAGCMDRLAALMLREAFRDIPAGKIASTFHVSTCPSHDASDAL